MRAVLRLLTALPLAPAADGRGRAVGAPDEAAAADEVEVGGGWVAAPVVGAGLGVAWFVTHQLAVGALGPLVAGAVVVAVAAALTGTRGHRGLAAVAAAATGARPAPAAPPAEGVATVVLVLLVVAQVALLQRINLAPAAVIAVPLAGRLAQVLLLRDGDAHVGVDPPAAGHKLAIAGLGGALLLLPAAAAPLVRPVRLDAPVVGLGYLWLGLLCAAVALAVGALARGWLLARFGRLDAAGWHAVGLLAELAALAALAVRIG